MAKKIIFLGILTLVLFFSACSRNNQNSTVIEERDRGEQQIIDNDSLIGYLETHYYNSGDFKENDNPSISDIEISELPKDDEGNYLGLPDPANNTLLIDAVETRTTKHLETDYTYYILMINQGGGSEKPNFASSVRVNYSGNTQDEVVFDSSVNPVSLDLTSVIVGWNRVLPEFNTALDFVLNQDGTVDYNNAGVGVMFLPSGLGYYSSSTAGIPSYSNLIFKFELFQMQDLDHDSDGVLSKDEDTDGDFSLIDDDEDGDNIPNYLDADDDGDGVLTINEDLEPDTDLTVDSNGDGDPTNDIGDGDPTNDDSDGDEKPNYLDTDDACSKEEDNNKNGIPDCNETT
jgi:FKBP-type peptidyl-prolyl cis-trans isomerase FkpA